MKIMEFINKLHKIVPENIALSFDNVGLLLGDKDSEITGIYVTLDVNEEVIDYVIKHNINTIIAHHPIIFNSIKKLINSNNVQRKIRKCIANNINVICCHTNLDAIVGGMNDYIVKFLQFNCKEIEILEVNSVDNKCGIGRILTLESPLEYINIVNKIKDLFNIERLRCVNSKKNIINRICVINGSGNSMVRDCFNKNIDLVITGDITYHTAFDAIENEVNLIDVGHFTSENLIYIEVMKDILNKLDVHMNVHYDKLLKEVYTYM